MITVENNGAMLGAAAITGFAVWNLHDAYCRVAPQLTELRDADCNGAMYRQRVLDADVYTGGLALLAGATASWLSKSWVPLAVLVAALAWVSYFHRAVLNGVTPSEIDKGE